VKKIIIDYEVHEEVLSIVKKKYKIVDCIKEKNSYYKTTLAKQQNVAGALLGSSWQIDKEVLDQLPSLEVIGRLGMGFDNIDIDEATKHGVVVLNTPNAPTVSTAEHAVSLLLALAKGHKIGSSILKQGKQLMGTPKLIELKDKILGIIGLGRIGKKVTTICKSGLGMKIVAYDPFLNEEIVKKQNIDLYDKLENMLPICDFVSLHCPLNKKTKGLININIFRIMKHSAYLINCARGKIVVEKDLIHALNTKEIAGAGIDVYDPEPPESSNILLHMENVITTPHSAGYTSECMKKISIDAYRGIGNVFKKIKPRYIVNPEVWDMLK
jgi:D-3-phosphoglycerate dehydrogenase / 2-oxoglutarate reductase